VAKEKTTFTCTECGGSSPRWLGKCPHCEAWNTLIETVPEQASAGRNRFASLAKTSEVAVLAEIEASEVDRTPTGIGELDRVLGGGIVEGGVVLIGGDPGIGKSTLLLQALDALQRAGQKTLYVTAKKAARRWRCARAAWGWTTRRSRCWPKSSWRKCSPRWTPC